MVGCLYPIYRPRHEIDRSLWAAGHSWRQSCRFHNLLQGVVANSGRDRFGMLWVEVCERNAPLDGGCVKLGLTCPRMKTYLFEHRVVKLGKIKVQMATCPVFCGVWTLSLSHSMRQKGTERNCCTRVVVATCAPRQGNTLHRGAIQAALLSKHFVSKLFPSHTILIQIFHEFDLSCQATMPMQLEAVLAKRERAEREHMPARPPNVFVDGVYVRGGGQVNRKCGSFRLQGNILT